MAFIITSKIGERGRCRIPRHFLTAVDVATARVLAVTEVPEGEEAEFRLEYDRAKMRSTHRVSLNGTVTVTLLDPFGQAVAHHVAHNRIVAGGQRLLANLLLGRSTQALATVAVGSGDAEPTPADTALAAEVYRKPIAEADRQVVGGDGQPLTVRLSVILGVNEPPEGDVELREIGLFDAADVLFSRALLPTPVIKTHDFALGVRWEIEIG